MSRIIDQFTNSIRSAADFNPDIQAAPHCILWTDQDRQWEVVIHRLQEEMPELFILGDYQPEKRTGPGIWLRCVLARTLADVDLPDDVVPVFYLPGISRQDLRAVDSCPDHLKPLAELQYRGVIWSQVNAKDWTVLAFLQTHHGGLNLDVAQDKETKTAMQLALPSLMDADVDRFRGKRLDKDDFYKLISSDPDRDLLMWLNDGDAYRQRKTDEEWRAFVELCRYHFAFNPETEGIISGAEKLAHHTGVWKALWERYKEVATKYRVIPERIRQANPPSNTLDWLDSSSGEYEGWPQWNDLQEDKLQDALKKVSDKPLQEAQKSIIELDRSHSHRRDYIWAEMGFSPLVMALKHLRTIAEVISNTPLDGGNISDLSNAYQSSGWRVDDAQIRALASVEKAEDRQLISDVLDAIYKPWAIGSARYLQQITEATNYIGGHINNVPNLEYPDGVCILFVDGLRFDVAKRLVTILENDRIDVSAKPKWSPLPSVTATGKPAASPIHKQFIGRNTSPDFEPEIQDSGKPANHRNHMRLLQENGWQVLDRMDVGDTTGRAWTEIDAIDKAGHDGTLPQRVDSVVREIKDRVRQLLDAGWATVEIVTDHGWLYLPSGLPKTDLPQSLTDNQWGRAAALKAGVMSEDNLFAWFWNPNHYFALADGIHCFRRGIKYAHGGLSLQECLTLQLTASQSNRAPANNIDVNISELDWRGLRCVITVDHHSGGMKADIRMQAANKKSSVAFAVKDIKTNGTASIVVEDVVNGENIEGQDAVVVILSESGQLLAQKMTVIGGEAQ